MNAILIYFTCLCYHYIPSIIKRLFHLHFNPLLLKLLIFLQCSRTLLPNHLTTSFMLSTILMDSWATNMEFKGSDAHVQHKWGKKILWRTFSLPPYSIWKEVLELWVQSSRCDNTLTCIINVFVIMANVAIWSFIIVYCNNREWLGPT